MSSLIEDFRKDFQLDDLAVLETDHWVWSVRPDQITLGSSVLSLKREALSFSDCTSAELLDLGDMCRMLEYGLYTAFGYHKINYLMLMMRDPVVHFHVFPRYNASPSFIERDWPDVSWPKPVDIFSPQGSFEECKHICNYLQQIKQASRL